jgi:hypothetical protein
MPDKSLVWRLCTQYLQVVVVVVMVVFFRRGSVFVERNVGSSAFFSFSFSFSLLAFELPTVFKHETIARAQRKRQNRCLVLGGGRKR